MKKMLIKNGHIQNPCEELFRGDILIEENKIVEVSESISGNFEGVVDASGCIITPGLIDQHIHGGYGCDFNTAQVDKVIEFAFQLARHGVTSFCPTVMTDTLDNIKRQIDIITEAKAKQPVGSSEIIGINLEGPFINPENKGAHNRELCIPLYVESYKQIESDEIKLITVAPELDEDMELVNYLQGKGVIVSVGHSSAKNLYGLHHVTHIFNAMPPLHHRNPGIIANALTDDDVYTEVIADHIHLSPGIINLIARSKPKTRVIFISDSLESKSKTMKKGDAAVNEKGDLIGSLVFLDTAVRKNVNDIGLKDLIAYCSLNPAQNLGLRNKGIIKPGMDADIVLWDAKTLEVKKVIINGEN